MHGTLRDEGRHQQRRPAPTGSSSSRTDAGASAQPRAALRARARIAVRHHLDFAGRPRLPGAGELRRARAGHPGAARVARAHRRQRRPRHRRPARRDGERLPRARPALGGAGQRRLAAVVEVRPGRGRHRLERPGRASRAASIQGHLARRRRARSTGIPTRGRSTPASRTTRPSRTRARAVALPVNAVWRFGIGGEKQESPTFQWGWSLATSTAATSTSTCAARARGDRRARRPRRLVRRREHRFPRRQPELDV